MKLKELRTAAGLTQSQLAAVLGVAQPTLCGWETGTARVPSDLLPRLADILGCTIDDIFGRASA